MTEILSDNPYVRLDALGFEDMLDLPTLGNRAMARCVNCSEPLGVDVEALGAFCVECSPGHGRRVFDRVF